MDQALSLCALETGSAEFCTSGNVENFWNFFTPPTPLTDDCLDTEPCFKTKDWEYWVDDVAYAGRVKNGELIGYLFVGTAAHEPLGCAEYGRLGYYCAYIGM